MNFTTTTRLPMALTTVLATGCATSPTAELAGELRYQCVMERIDTIQVIGVRNSVGIHQGCARSALGERNQIPH